MPATLEEHLFAPGPKRVLALDGGGIRGIITIAFLKEFERVLKERLGGANDFRLCDYFDLVGVLQWVRSWRLGDLQQLDRVHPSFYSLAFFV